MRVGGPLGKSKNQNGARKKLDKFVFEAIVIYVNTPRWRRALILLANAYVQLRVHSMLGDDLTQTNSTTQKSYIF